MADNLTCSGKCLGVPRARRSNVQFDVEESPIVEEGSLKSTSWARKPTSNRSTFDVERSPDLKPSDHAGVAMEADVQYKEEQARPLTFSVSHIIKQICNIKRSRQGHYH